MGMRFFNDVTDIKELKRYYIVLLKKWHPDNYSEQSDIDRAVSMTQEINSEYEIRLEQLKKHDTTSEYSQEEQKQNYYYWKFDEEFRSVISILVSCSYISEIELCGCFIWFKVDYNYRKQLKTLPLDFDIRYAPKKKLFFICLNRDYRKRTFREMNMSHIRDMYGSETFASSKSEEKLIQSK
ncbi:MAG: hypothetical protein ACLRZ9_02375 [Eubacterium sp.]